jgi:N-acetylmuramoyl-L-alanine amidase
MMKALATPRVRKLDGFAALIAGGALAIAATFPPVTRGQAQPSAYTVLTAQGRRSLPFHVAGQTDDVSLDQLASLFNLTVTEDAVVGGLTVTAKGQRIALIPGQAFASVSGRVISLGGPVQRDRNGYQVPIDLLSRAVGPALATKIDVRRAAHRVIVGDLRVPQISGHVERDGTNAKITIEMQPATPHRVTREGKGLVVHFDAEALDATPITGFLSDFVTSAHVDGASLVLDLGPQAASFDTQDDRDQTHVTISLLAPGQPPKPPAPPPQEAPVIDIARPGVIRTVVIDPGHGGADEGTHGASGTKEKDLTLAIARKVKTTIESRLGVRVLLTRDADEDVPTDRRCAIANNNKADIFISLHADASVRPSVRGAQVLTLSLDEYKSRLHDTGPRVPVAVLGGGTRVIDPVPWDLAQIPFADRSASVGADLVRRLAEKNVPLFSQPAVQAPMRVLLGANMPAVLLEVGFLTNKDDEQALAGAEIPNAIVEAVAATVADQRGGGTE